MKKELKSKGANIRLRKRSVIICVIILLFGFGSAIFRLAQLSLVQGEELKNLAVNQQLRDTTINAKRGTIYDANMKVLAQSATVWKVVINPANFEFEEEREVVAQGLAEILDLDYEDVLEKTKQNLQYVEVKRQIESDTREEILNFIEELEDRDEPIYSIITLLEDYKRYYPYGTFASSVIGFTGAENQGLAGLEYQYDEILTGTPGRLVEAKNANGTEMPYSYEQKVDAIDGNSIVLSIDETVQSIVEKYLDEYNEEFKVYNRSVGIMMDVNTGEILAMASQGGFDCNDPFTIIDEEEIKRINELPEDEQSEAEVVALEKQWRNKAISDTYYPGSVWKIMTSAMALEEGLVSEDSTYTCSGSYVPFEGASALHCHKDYPGHGTQSFAQAILNSCNPAFMQIGNLIGTENFWQYYQAFGFSEKTGIDLPGESEDIFFSQDGSMGPMDLAVSSFGQNFSITPLQMVTGVSAIANGGTLYEPHVVKQILDSDGNVLETIEPEAKRDIVSTETADELAAILEENSVSGGGLNSYVQGYRVAGKTGTTEKKIDVTGDGNDDYISSFAGFAPANDPQVALLVYFDAPTTGIYYGSQVAAPCFADIMEEVLPYLEVETQYSEDEISILDTTAGDYIGLSLEDAKSQVREDGFTPIIKGNGDKVISQIPSMGDRIPQQGTIVLYTDDTSLEEEKVTVPDLTGMSLADVNYVASQYNLNISVSGISSAEEGVSKSQDIAVGTQVNPGQVIKVTFTIVNNENTNIM